jgi:hypothetical protein
MKEIAKVETENNALMAIINRASTDQAFDVAKLESLLAMKERWDREQARKAFVVALTDFKSDPPEVFKNHAVSFETQKGNTSYKHATLDQASSIIGATASKHGLSHRWDVDQSKEGKIKVTCIVTHVLGHSESVCLESMSDSSGGKNSIQAIGSAISYLERYTLFAAYGIAAKDQDDDGCAAGAPAERQPIETTKVVDPVKFRVTKGGVVRQKTNPIQFRITASDGTIYYTLIKDIAAVANAAGESGAELMAMLTNSGGSLWIDSISEMPAVF